MKKGKVTEVWIIAECPHCNRPLTKNRYVINDTMVVKPLEVRCEYCDKRFEIDLEVYQQKGEHW
jgi:hypothetical protein